MERITGNGAPTRTTVGVVGQHYEDLNTGNIYECLVASEHSKIHGPIMGGYIWKLMASGEDREDHSAIFGDIAKLIDDKLGSIIAWLGQMRNATEWTVSDQASCDSFNNIVYGNNVWVATANTSMSNGSILYSLDGKSWVKLSVTGYFCGLCYGNGLFVACTNNGALYYSEDGKTWNNLNQTVKAQRLYYANGVYHAYHPSDYSGVSCLHYSTDGETWTSVENVTRGVECLKYANGVWVATLYGGKGAYYSTDGMTWTQSNITSGYMNHVYYANGMWIAGGNNSLYSSSDGMTWTEISDHPFIGASANQIYGIINFDSKWIIATYRAGLVYTEDFVKWNNVISEISQPRTMYAANGICICNDESSRKIYYSVDGTDWLLTNLTDHTIGAIHYSDRMWVLGAGIFGTDGLYYSIG